MATGLLSTDWLSCQLIVPTRYLLITSNRPFSSHLSINKLKYLHILSAAHGFPSSFETIVRKILRLLFHVLAHLYHSHFREMVMLNLHSHLNSVFTHLILVNDCYHLIEERELDILFDLVNALKILDSNGPPTKPAAGDTIDNVGTNGCSVTTDGQTLYPADTKQVCFTYLELTLFRSSTSNLLLDHQQAYFIIVDVAK